MTHWRHWLIDYRKQHPRLAGYPKPDKAKMVKPRIMTGKELSSLRKRRGLYQREMAFKLGITRRQLSRLETRILNMKRRDLF